MPAGFYPWSSMLVIYLFPPFKCHSKRACNRLDMHLILTNQVQRSPQPCLSLTIKRHLKRLTAPSLKHWQDRARKLPMETPWAFVFMAFISSIKKWQNLIWKSYHFLSLKWDGVLQRRVVISSWCNTLYKLAAKIMMMSLESVLGNLNPLEQSSFIPSRSTSDNILIARCSG